MTDIAWQDPPTSRRSSGPGPGEVGSNGLEAKKVCASCPVLAECDEYAQGEHFGVWAGKSRTGRGGRRRVVEPIVHGTARGYRQHRARHEDPCLYCLRGHATEVAIRKEYPRQEKQAS